MPREVCSASNACALLVAKLGHRSVVDRAASGGNGEQACFAEVA
jgi:hypothetical protein